MRLLVFVYFLCAIHLSCRGAGDEARGGLWQGSFGDFKTKIHMASNVPSNFGRRLVVYIKGLATERIGTEDDASIIADLLRDGFCVFELDYENNPKARMPWINKDLGKLREQIRSGALLPGIRVDNAHCYIVPSGCRIRRDLVFYRDSRVLAADIIYPSKPKEKTGTVIEFSCDNQDRMGNASLSICSDTLLDGFACEGFAVAMLDHPVAAPYKGFDAMPDCARKIKAGVRAVRRELLGLGLSEKIIPVGFSRGSGMALMLLSTEGLTEFDGFGEVGEGTSAVDGAIIMSGRFTYLDLLPTDNMIPRYEAAWGKRNEAEEVWRKQGALEYLSRPTKPLFLTINCTESSDALHQMDVLQKRLKGLGSEYSFRMDRVPRGHKVTLDEEILTAMRDYAVRQLK